MVERNNIKLSRLLEQQKRAVKIQPEQEYHLLGVKWYGKGVFVREAKKGREIKASKLFQVKEGDFIYNRLFAWKSSFAIITDEFDGCFVSNEFPTFVCDSKKLNPEFLLSYILLPQNIDKVNKLSGGMSSVSRKRFKEEYFLDFELPVCDVNFQKHICDTLRTKQVIIESLGIESNQQLSFLKQLRQAFLQEAVEGKLTAEWRKKHPELISGENHASALLEQIKAEKSRLIKEGKIKKEKPLPPIKEEETPFELPEGWVWCRVGETAQHALGKMLDQAKNKGTYQHYLRNLNVRWFGFDLSDLLEMRFQDREVEKYTAIKGDLLICEGGYPGRAAIWTSDAPVYYQKALHRVRFFIPEINKWFLYFLFLSDLNRYIEKYFTGAGIQHFTGKALNRFVYPLPPIAEQQTIVERVDRLMTMIDELEKQVSERKEKAEMLMQSVLREAFAG